jgi:4-hydroxy-3-polyprenylbenzoate decarboxylase
VHLMRIRRFAVRRSHTESGSRMGVDATTKWPSEGFDRPWPDEIKTDPEVKKKIDALWAKLGL